MISAFSLAAAADLPRILNLVDSAYRGGRARAGWTHEADLIAGPRTDLATLHAIFADRAQRLIVAQRDHSIIGSVVVADRGDGVAYLGMLAVDPHHQAHGVGRMLISEAERRAATDFRAILIEMTVIGRRTELIAYYQRRGYTLTGERRPFPFEDRSIGDPLTDDLDFVVLARSLAID